MDRLDKWIFLSITVLFAVVVGLLLDDLGIISLPFSSKEISQNQVLGKVSKKDRTLERREKDQLSWDEINADEKLFAYDSVLTLENSTADLKLGNDLDLRLNENSLISILPPEDQMMALNLFLGSGSYNLTLKRGQVIKVNKVIFEGKDDASLTFKKKNKDEVTVSVTKGAVKVTNFGAQATTGEASAGQDLIIESDRGTATINAPPPPAAVARTETAVPSPPKMKAPKRKLAQVKPKEEPKTQTQKTETGKAGQDDDVSKRPDPEAMSQDLSELPGN